jgi:hypothetical protein
MLKFTASETLFMVSMACCYFYSWQTYAVEDDTLGDNPYNGQEELSPELKPVVAVEMKEAVIGMWQGFSYMMSATGSTLLVNKFMVYFQPINDKFETLFGQGGSFP